MSRLEIDKIYREVHGKLITSLVSYFGMTEISVAEDLVQDTFTSALETWQTKPPDNPEAWLFKVCKNKAINYLRKNNREKKSSLYEQNITDAYHIDQLFLPHEIQNSRLRLIFAFCHPSLPEKAQVVLILRLIGGFKIEEISRALGLSIEGVKKILVRAKKMIKDNALPLKVPFVLKSNARLQIVHKTLYLIFNEGYSASSGDLNIRQELCMKSFTLNRTLIEEGIGDSCSLALMALMLFNMARMPARLSNNGELQDLESQDRNLWDESLIKHGFHFMNQSRLGNKLSNYHLEAGIASLHCSAKAFEETDWCAILNYYDQLFRMNASPFVWLNRCIALSYCDSPKAALNDLDKQDYITALSNYYLYHVTLGKLRLKTGNYTEAKLSFERGLALTKVSSEREYITLLIDKTRPSI